ncbi:hypothetical protein M5W83_06675 [Paenibacillus thiaminolyticus]|uniref:Uncharacterized protein n=1 Tax=Paenibacillus thiaminolyticus TaxID=49283 RepID=A0AAP9IZH0_PANTH|nr:hypothetical protein [Paenibacillus thiaminolyticus]MCY9534810.1 hypothetical protein [Paenibacillus thiaminolyticus]MCY9603935.1 hypothetical protein [Paenibacillus thiaminolyticus]MCY9606839.1 hypothetical protein [Paenibacillus thiaminolyticus]MCY9615831.1 hypothetical protein [Paenibacillus thiaminolyticus]MCY9619065.1 hypothetical protein [Paenibacillus thiaminolyticus]
MAGIIGHTMVTTAAALAYKKQLNITTLFAGMAFPDIMTHLFVYIPFIPGVSAGVLDETFLGGVACAIFLTLLVMLGLKTMPKAMYLFSYKQSTSLKVILLSALAGTELHVLMDKIAINGWITF